MRFTVTAPDSLCNYCFRISYSACVCAGGYSVTNVGYRTNPYYISCCLFRPFPRLSTSFSNSNPSLQYSCCLSQSGVICEYHRSMPSSTLCMKTYAGTVLRKDLAGSHSIHTKTQPANY